MEEVKPKILLVEDEANLGTLLKDYLNVKGFDTVLCTDGQQGFDTFAKQKFDLCILDIMLPVKDGYTLAKEIRQADKHVPIIFLTAKSLPDDKIEGFKSGADDYLTKPFNMEELLFRVKAVLKRASSVPGVSDEEGNFVIGNFTFDPTKQILKSDTEERKLTSKEAELLRLLCLNMNKTMDRNFALKTIWHDDSYFNARSMDVYITKLRKYLKADPRIEILNVHGKGFKLLVNNQE
ncbi:MAG: response regulator transcription factor [Flavobacteriales bacterium]|nr:response regulator transcription factor [Flavobacteriales bacterium]